MSTVQLPTVQCPNCGKVNRVRPAAPAVPHCGACHKPLPWVVDADDAAYQSVVEESPLPVLVEFWASWCGPCRKVGPIVEQLAREWAGRLKVAKVNADTSQLGRRFNVLGIPTLMLLERGRVTDRLTGAIDVAALRRWLDRHLTSQKST